MNEGELASEADRMVAVVVDSDDERLLGQSVRNDYSIDLPTVRLPPIGPPRVERARD